jgi:carboxyl-terminal processing protease
VRRIIALAGLAAALIFAGAAEAKVSVPSYSDLPKLEPQPQHATACSRIGNFFTRAHYKVITLDEDFASKVIDQYLSYLDYNRSLLTSAEVSSIRDNRALVLRALRSCELDYPFKIYENAMKKRFVKYKYFLDAASGNKINVTADQNIEIDRRKAPFFDSEADLRTEWDAEIKNEYINQILSGKSDEKARERLVKRYSAALKKLVQTKPEDAFSTFENAFASAIDPHTNYFSPADSENFNEDMNLSLEGIGAVLTSDDEYTTITEIIPGSPAERSKKLRAKDRIVGVRQQDGTYDDIIGWRLSDVVKKVKGPKGTRVTLEIERGDGASAKTFSVELVRDRVRLQDREAKGEVRTAKDGAKVGVISVKSFYTNLHSDIKRELDKLKSQNVSAVIIDLRTDGGGLLPEAVDSTGLFIKSGPVVVVRDMTGAEAPQYDSDPSIAYDGPLVVMINRLSASSSEIMAAALRDYGRALIVGSTSFGKGTVQQNRPLERIYDLSREPLGAIHYTIAKFYRVTGGSTQLKGVEPDISLPELVDSAEFGERNEKNALPWDSIMPVRYEPYLNISAYVPAIRKAHEARTANDPVFKVLDDEMARYRQLKAEKYLSVNLEKRRAIKKQDDEFRLKAANIRLKAMGRPLLKNISDLPDDFEFADVLLDEAVNIASDLAKAEREHTYTAASAPVFSRYAPPAEESASGR